VGVQCDPLEAVDARIENRVRGLRKILKIVRHFADKIFKGDHHEYPVDSSFENSLFEGDYTARSGAM